MNSPDHCRALLFSNNVDNNYTCEFVHKYVFVVNENLQGSEFQQNIGQNVEISHVFDG